MLNRAGYGIPDSDTNFIQGVYIDPTAIVYAMPTIGANNNIIDVMICTANTNDIGGYPFLYATQIDGQQSSICFWKYNR